MYFPQLSSKGHQADVPRCLKASEMAVKEKDPKGERE